MRCHFNNPYDLMMQGFPSLEEAREAAKKYIGKEDGFGDKIEQIAIFNSEPVEIVREGE